MMLHHIDAAMAPASTLSCAICFILMNTIFSSFVASDFLSRANTTEHASSWKGRSKRSPYDGAFRLKITIKYKSEDMMDLTYTKVREDLANKYLPVFTTHLGSNPNVMTDIGEFILYHDLSKRSAIVYFEKFKTLYGVIGMKYFIQDLPFNFDQDGVYQSQTVGEPYVKKQDYLMDHINPSLVHPPPSDSDAWYDFLSPVPDDSTQSQKRTYVCESSSSNKRQRTEQNNGERIVGEMLSANEYRASISEDSASYLRYQHYYVETLVFVTRDIVEIFTKFFGTDRHIEWIVRYLIIYFNAVDMMFRKVGMTYAGIHINIAKIVIENELMPFDFISGGELQFTNIVEKLPQYLYSHPSEYPPDSFDSVFVYTSRPIFDGIIQVNGLTKYGSDLYEARKNNQFYEVVPISVVMFQYYYADYGVAVHELGRILGLKMDCGKTGLESVGQCYGIMQREGPKCDKCLEWSPESQTQLETLFRTNKNRCFLLNKPRSLQPPGVSSFSRPNGQCRCFGYESYVKLPSGSVRVVTGKDECARPLQCQKSGGLQLDYESTVLPLDGTPCTRKKVCWGRKCTYVTNPIKSPKVLIK